MCVFLLESLAILLQHTVAPHLRHHTMELLRTDVDTIEAHGQVLEIAQVDVHIKRSLRIYDFVARPNIHLGGGHVSQFVAQLVDALPLAPAFQGRVDEIILRLVIIEMLCASHSGSTADVEVAIKVNERVEFLLLVEAVNLPVCRGVISILQRLDMLLGNHLIGSDECCLAVSLRLVIVVQRLHVASLKADDTQEVVIEVLAVNALHHHRLKLRCLMSRQQVGIRQCLGIIDACIAAFLNVSSVSVLVRIAKSAIVNCSQNGVCLLCFSSSLLELFNFCVGRIGIHLCNKSRAHQLRLQKISVRLLALCLGNHLVKCFDGGLRHVFLHCCIHIAPQLLVVLSENPHRCTN